MKTLSVTQRRKNETLAAIQCVFVYLLIVIAIFAGKSQIHNPAVDFSVLFGLGYLTWTFMEYFMHRFWMHNNFKNINNKTYQSHMNHHKHPTEIKITRLQRISFFITGLILLATAIYLLNYFTFFVGFYFGFVFYTVLHVILHHRWGKYILPRVQTAHIHHHGKYPDTGFSFSTILWDYMFGTMAPKDAEVSDKMKMFYFKPDNQ